MLTHGLIFYIMSNIDWGGIAQAGAGLLGTIFNASSAAGTNRETLRFTEEQQEKQNQFSHDEAILARDFLQKMSSSEISRRVADMRAAGMNPAFALGMSGDGVGSSPQASAPVVSSPNLHAPQVDPLTLSQIKLNESQANKNDAEAENTQKQTDWLDALNQSTIDVNTADVAVKGSVVGVNEETKKKIAKDIESAEQGIKNLKKEIELMDSEITKNDIDAFWASGRYSAEIEQLKSQTHLNDAECKEIFTLLFSKKALLDAQTNETLSRSELNKANTRLTNVDTKYHFWLGRQAYWDAGQSRINYELSDKFGEADHWVAYANLGLTHIENIGGLVMDYKRLGLAKRDLDERERHNRANESNDVIRSTNESIRDNETARHHRATEYGDAQRSAENARHNRQVENETYRHNDYMEQVYSNRMRARYRP